MQTIQMSREQAHLHQKHVKRQDSKMHEQEKSYIIDNENESHNGVLCDRLFFFFSFSLNKILKQSICFERTNRTKIYFLKLCAKESRVRVSVQTEITERKCTLT